MNLSGVTGSLDPCQRLERSGAWRQRRLYQGKLHTLGSWKQWTTMIELLDEKVAAAFAGDLNLHGYETQIDSLAAIYERLRAEASDNKLVVAVPSR